MTGRSALCESLKLHKNRQNHFVIDGEAIARGVDGYSDSMRCFKPLDADVELIAFDVLALGRDDFRRPTCRRSKALRGAASPRLPFPR
jgi:ATP-dependent DNA ligase